MTATGHEGGGRCPACALHNDVRMVQHLATTPRCILQYKAELPERLQQSSAPGKHTCLACTTVPGHSCQASLTHARLAQHACSAPMEPPQARAQDGVVELPCLCHHSWIPLPQLSTALHIRQHQRQRLALACSHTDPSLGAGWAGHQQQHAPRLETQRLQSCPWPGMPLTKGSCQHPHLHCCWSIVQPCEPSPSSCIHTLLA